MQCIPDGKAGLESSSHQWTYTFRRALPNSASAECVLAWQSSDAPDLYAR